MTLWRMRAVLCLAAGAVSSFGQNCPSGSTRPGCVIPDLFGSSAGISLANQTHAAHFQSDFQTNFTALNSAIATQLANLPLISPASGFTYEYDSTAGVFVRSATSFGPILTERAETIGRGKTYFGVSYQRFRFSNIDGQDLHNLPAVFKHDHDDKRNNPDGTPGIIEADFISTNNNIDLRMDQVTLFGTVGVTDRLDVSVALPILSTRMSVSSDAAINRVAPPSDQYAGAVGGQAHFFNSGDPNGSTHASFRNSGTASGVGDVVFRIKGNVVRTDALRLALAMDVRAPSGSERDFLGSGAIGVKPFVAVSFGKHVSPHVNLGYQFNGKSVLAGNLVTGEKRGLPDQFFYSIGTDMGVTKNLTLAFDYLGQQLFDAARVRTTSFTSRSSAIFASRTLPDIGLGAGTFGLNNGAAGFKYNLFGKMLLTANLLFRMDNNGLRQSVTPMVALSYAFGE